MHHAAVRSDNLEPPLGRRPGCRGDLQNDLDALSGPEIRQRSRGERRAGTAGAICSDQVAQRARGKIRTRLHHNVGHEAIRR